MVILKQGKTNIKYLLIVVILVAIAGGGILWCITKEKTPETQLLEEKGIEKSLIIQQVLSNKEINEILREFAEGKTVRFNDIGADKVLLDALEFKNGEIKSRLRSIKINIENLSDEIQDAPDMRSLFTQQVKTCIAESIIYDDIKSILKYCGYQQSKEPINLTAVDDLTATEQILPHFIAGFAYYSEEDYSGADYYFEQIKLHRAELEKYGYGNESYLELYNKIYNKALEISSDTVKDETADWKIYRNEEYGFEFKYPQDVNEFFGSPEQALVHFDYDYGGKFSWYDRFGIFATSKQSKNYSLEELKEWILNNEVCILGMEEVLTSATETMVDREKGIKITIPSGVGFCPMSENSIVTKIYVQHDTRIYGFEGYQRRIDEKPLLEERNIFLNQILSTFKFLQ